MSFELNSIINAGDDYAPPRILVYATHGLGKTTFGASFESPILLRIEDGASAIDVPTFPNKAESYADISAAINALHGEHRDAASDARTDEDRGNAQRHAD